MVGRLPDSSLPGHRRAPVRPNHLVHPAELRVDLKPRDELPLLLEGLHVRVGLRAVLFVQQQQRVQPLELHPPLLLAVLGPAERRAVAVEPASLPVPAECQRVVHEHPRHARGSRVVATAERRLGLVHQVRRLDVVAVRVVIGDRAPIRREELVHHPGLDRHLVANHGEELRQARPQRLVLPDSVELGERLQQVEVRVHRLETDEPDTGRPPGRLAPVDDRALPGQVLEVAALPRIVRVLVDPAERPLSEGERLGVTRGLVRGGGAVQAEAHPVQVLGVAEDRRDRPILGQVPVESAVLLVPEDAGQVRQPVPDHRQEAVLQFGAAPDHLRGNPRHAALEHRELPAALRRRPVAREAGVETAVHRVHAAREPGVEHVAPQHGLHLAGQSQVGLPRRAGVGGAATRGARRSLPREQRPAECDDHEHGGERHHPHGQ